MKHFRLLLAVILSAGTLFAGEIVRTREVPASEIGLPASVAVGDSFRLKLFDDVEMTLAIVAKPPAGIAGQSFIAKDESGSASAIVKFSGNTARISIDDFMNRRQYTVRVKNGIATITERDNSQMDDGECGTCGGDIEVPQTVVEETKTTSTKKSRTLLGATGNEFPLAEQKSVVDILVAFDRGAKNWLNNGNCEEADTIEEFADYAVNKMNMVLQNSQLDDKFCYRLVGVTEVDDSWTKIDSDLLSKVRTRDGKLARLGQLRDKCGADTITLLVNKTSGTTAGIGYGLSNVAANDVAGFNNANCGVNICDIKAVYDRYTMSHETGHNMGCGHSDKQGNGSSGSSAGPQSEPYSCGYHFYDANNVRRYTVMAYSYTSGQSPDYTDYKPVPYFSSPDITPAEYGVPVGTEEKNNNRKVLMLTHESVSNWREHMLPYDWDVRFLDDNGKDIVDGSYFYTACDVTLTSSIPDSEIYYTVNGSTNGTTPTKESDHGASGTKLNAYLVYGPKTITASVVTNGVALSVRSITLRDGITWSGDANGNGVWASSDSSVKPWSGQYFYGDSVVFPDLPDVSSATVTVWDAVSPASVSFQACETEYTFDKGTDSAQINISDAVFAPAGDVTFNVPVKLDAVAFTNIAGRVLTFNAPFGQTVDSTSGTFTGMVNIGPSGTLTVAPGNGKTQTIEKLNNIGWYAGTSTFRIGEGTVVFNGAINGGAGVIGRTKLEVGNGGELIFNQGGGTGYDMDNTSLTVEKGGTVTFNDMELLKRTLYLDGGTIYAKRLDLMSNPGIYVTDDSAIEDNTEGYIYLRGSDSEINISDGKTLILGIRTDNRNDTAGNGIVKKGGGTLVANAELKHSGVTDIEEGSLEVGYSSGSATYGQGWIVASNATLRVKGGCTLKVPSLTLDPTSIISLPAATSAPLVVNGNVDLTDVRISIQAGGDLSLGASYPLISATGNISGIKSLVRESWPKLGTGLGWKIAVSGGVLTASIVNAAESDPYVDFITNVSDLRPALPDDATMTDDGGLRLASTPIVFDNLNETAVSITLDVTLGEPTAGERTICSWKIGSYVVRCVVTNGVIDCFWADNSHVANSAQSIKLSPGRHTINIGYKSLSDDTYGGTFVYADGQLAYRAAGLRWSNDKVSRLTIGASAAETPAYKYDGLVVNSLALLTSSAKEPLPNMTSSGGAVEYSYFAGKPPCVFALTPDGGFETYGAVLSAGLANSYEALSVSVLASFPEDATGTIFSSVVRPSGSYASYATQVEYRGDGVLAFRDDGGDSLATTCKVSADMASPHLYTMTYKMGVGFKCYMDGEEVMSNSAYFQGKSLLVWARVVFGCGYWTDWMSSYNDNPNPISNLKVYASHIALGTDDRTVSEAAVKEATGYEPEEPVEPDPEPPETPAVVDVLVAFDNGAQAYVANNSQTLEEFAAVQIGKMNDVLVTNKLDRFYSYRLAGVCKVDGVYDNIDTAPAQIAAGTGPAVSLRAAREMCGADTVTLLVDVSGNTLGNSSPLNSPDNVASQHECAFSVCSIRAVDTGKQHTMIHENAHNMGCGHSRRQERINSPFEYGRGYYFMDGSTKRHTIMAYDVDSTGVYANPSPYFSTASKEFGFTLGDKTNNNARVLKETCGEVAKWRDSVKPNNDELIVTDENGNEITANCFFKDNIKVTVTAPIAGADLFYTFDGTDPVVDYDWFYQTSPSTFTFKDDRVLKIAYYDGEKLSPIRTINAYKCANVPADGLWQTSKKYPWCVDSDGFIRSYNQTDYTYQCTTPLKATVVGPKVLSFKHKSYFLGEDLGSNYSHIEVLLDDSAVLSSKRCNTEWSDDVKVYIPDGKHTVQFVYSQRDAMNNPKANKDNYPAEMDDALWLKDIALSKAPESLFWSSTSEDVSWLVPGYSTVGDEHLDSVAINDLGIVNYLDFGSTNAVVLSVLAELPENGEGALMGLVDVRDSSKHPIYAYSNGDGTIMIYYDSKAKTASSVKSARLDVTGLHVWTLAYCYDAGAKFYLDGVEVASDAGIKWTGNSVHKPAECLTFGSAYTNAYPLTGAKIYAVHSDFGNSAFVSVTNNPATTVSDMLKTVPGGNEFVDETLETQLALLNVYKELGYIPDKSDKADRSVLRISEIMPKPTDAQNRGALEGMDVNGLESGWVEVENTSDKWADLADYRFIRVNRGKKTDPAGFGNFPSRLVPPRGRAIFYTSERYSNSKDKAVSAFAEGTFDGKPMIFEDYGNILVWGDKVNPKKSPFVRLYYMPDAATTNVVDTVVIPSDLPEGWSIIVGDAAEGEGTRRWMCPTPTRGRANTSMDGLKRIGPNVGPLYEIKDGKKHEDSPNEFARPVPPAKPGEDYAITLPINPVMNPNGTFSPRAKDAIASIKLVYRKDLDDSTLTTNDVALTKKTDKKAWGDQYTATIPASYFPAAGHLIQWKVLITDGEGVEWTSPSFNNPDDGYEWYGTIVEAPELESATLPTWHMFVDNASKAQMDYDKDDSCYTLPNGARVAIYDSSTSNYYDYVRIDLRGHTSANFTKKGHGLRFAKAHPLTMVDSVTGETIEEIRKTSLISEFADPSYMRQMIAFWLWKKMGNLVPFDFPVRCNMNGEFYQLAFNSERFTDELIEDVYGLDKYGYSWKNVGTLKSDSSTTAGSIEKKTPDDEDESNVTVLEGDLRSKLKAYGAQNAAEDTAALTKFVVQKFDLPAWINYLASARITQEMDDVWANVCIYYDNPDMKEGARGTGTWMPLGYDFNLSFGQYFHDSNVDIRTLMSNQDWFKSHPFYGGNRIRCYTSNAMTGTINNGNDGFEAVWQSSKFRRLYLRRLRTLMDQELKEPGTATNDTPFMVKMYEMADLMRADAALDTARWPNDNSDNSIDAWQSITRPANMDAGIQDIWDNYVVPRREHLYVTHSVTNTAKAIGYASNLNAGIPEAQSPIAELAPNISLDMTHHSEGYVTVSNANNEVVDMSGWILKFGVEWELPAGTVCDSNDCIYIVKDRRAFVSEHSDELTNQVIVGNATFGDVDTTQFESSNGTLLSGISSGDNTIVFSAKDQNAADEIAKTAKPELTEEDKKAELDVNYLTVVAEPVKEGKTYKLVVAVNPSTVEKPEVDTPAAEPMTIEDDTEDSGKKTVSISISNAIKGLWYGYEVSDALGENANFANDVDSFERATGPAHKVKGSPRDKASGFFRIKVLPAKPSH